MAWTDEAKRFPGGTTGWFKGWSVTNTDADITIAGAFVDAFPQMTAVEANGTTGDIRKVLYAICEKCWLVWNAIVTANRCANMTIGKSSSTNVLTGKITHQYVFTFVNTISSEDVADEA